MESILVEEQNGGILLMKKVLAAILVLMLLLCGTMGMAESENGDLGELIDGDFVADEFISVKDYAKTEGLSDEWWNVLLLGTDDRYDDGSYGRTDSMIILSVNLGTGESKMTSLMRDTLVNIGGKSCKLNAASVYGGPELSMRTINEYFGMNISDYVILNIEGLADIIDTLGGLELDVTEAERKALNRGLFDLSSMSGMEKLQSSGEGVHLNGNQAVAYARIRKIDSDYRRTERQRAVLMKIAEKLQNYDLMTVINVIKSVIPYVETNLSISDIMTLAYHGMQMDLSAVEQLRLPTDETSKAGMYGDIWCIRPDFEANKEILHDFIYG